MCIFKTLGNVDLDMWGVRREQELLFPTVFLKHAMENTFYLCGKLFFRQKCLTCYINMLCSEM